MSQSAAKIPNAYGQLISNTTGRNTTSQVVQSTMHTTVQNENLKVKSDFDTVMEYNSQMTQVQIANIKHQYELDKARNSIKDEMIDDEIKKTKKEIELASLKGLTQRNSCILS